MIRVVLTVLLAVALLGVSLPVLEDVRAETTTERIGTEAERIERAAAAVTADSVAVDEAELAARASLVVRAPSGFDAAPIDDLTLVNADSGQIDGTGIDRLDGTAIDGRAIGGNHRVRATDATVALAYRLRGGPVRAVAIPNPADTVDLAVVDGPIALQSAGESRIEFRFVEGETRTTVRITRNG